jgi:hypothetical protein
MNIRNFYALLTKKHHTTTAEVEKEIQKAIKYAYLTNNQAAIFKNGLPSNEQFIKWVIEQTKMP